jgi:hypothetical protein
MDRRGHRGARTRRDDLLEARRRERKTLDWLALSNTPLVGSRQRQTLPDLDVFYDGQSLDSTSGRASSNAQQREEVH